MTSSPSVKDKLFTVLAYTAAGAATGGVAFGGAEVLGQSEYDHYSASQVAYTGFIGGAVIGGACGFLDGLISAYQQQTIAERSYPAPICAGATVGNSLATLTGHGILTSTGYASSPLALCQTAAAVGTVIFLPALAWVMLCGTNGGPQCWASEQGKREPAGYLPGALEAVVTHKDNRIASKTNA